MYLDNQGVERTMEKQHWEKIVKDASKKEMYVQFSILTFEDWREQPDEVIRCLERSRRGFAADKYPELKYHYGVNYTNGRLNIGEHTERRWSNIQKRLKAGEVRAVDICRDKKPASFSIHCPWTLLCRNNMLQIR